MNTPEKWKSKPLIDLVSDSGVMRDGDWVESKDQDPHGKVRLIQLADIGNGIFLNKSSRFLTEEKADELRCTYLEAGDVLVSRLGDPLGKACIFPELKRPCVTVVDVHIFRAANENVSHAWLVHFLNAPQFRSSIHAKSSGTTRKRITGKKLQQSIVPVPQPSQQIVIADKIDELFSQIDEGERALARVQKLVERYRQSVLKAAVTGELTRDWREKHAGANGSAGETGAQLLQRILKVRREAWEKAELEKMAAKGETPNNSQWKQKYKQPPQPNLDELPTLPPRWTWVSLEQICFVETGATPKRGTSEFYENGTVPWVTSTAVNHAIIDEADEFITQAALDKTNTKIFPAGSLVVAMYGEGKTRGKVSELGIDAATNQACAALLCSHVKPVVKQYIRLFLEKNYEAIRVSSAGGVQPNLNLSKLRNLRVPLPTLDEIMQIIESVAVRHADIVSLSDTLPASRNHSKALRQSILKAAFSGNLSPAIQPTSNAPLKNQYE